MHCIPSTSRTLLGLSVLPSCQGSLALEVAVKSLCHQIACRSRLYVCVAKAPPCPKQRSVTKNGRVSES